MARPTCAKSCWLPITRRITSVSWWRSGGCWESGSDEGTPSTQSAQTVLVRLERGGLRPREESRIGIGNEICGLGDLCVPTGVTMSAIILGTCVGLVLAGGA